MHWISLGALAWLYAWGGLIWYALCDPTGRNGHTTAAMTALIWPVIAPVTMAYVLIKASKK